MNPCGVVPALRFAVFGGWGVLLDRQLNQDRLMGLFSRVRERRDSGLGDGFLRTKGREERAMSTLHAEHASDAPVFVIVEAIASPTRATAAPAGRPSPTATGCTATPASRA